ncbi:MAG TPA: hypothetical protein VN112_07160 [Ensifer sp.]|nr:hypothetical protein [Ensifer sp.]
MNQFLTDDAPYRAAISHCAASILPMHLGERLINKIFGRTVPSHAAGLIAIMHAQSQLGLGEPATLGVLQDSFGSRRTLASFVSLLKLANFVDAVEKPDDRRIRYLVPTAQMTAGLREWLSHHLRCAEIAGMELPHDNMAQRFSSDQEFSTRFIAASRSVLERSRQALKGEHGWAWFDQFDCGDRIALKLCAEHFSAEPNREGHRWFPLGSRTLASQLGVSHSHVRNVVNAAERQGYLYQDRGPGNVLLSHDFLADVRAWHLMFWSWVAETAVAAHADTGGLAEGAVTATSERAAG